MTITGHAESYVPQKAINVYQTLSSLGGGVWGQDYISVHESYVLYQLVIVYM